MLRYSIFTTFICLLSGCSLAESGNGPSDGLEGAGGSESNAKFGCENPEPLVGDHNSGYELCEEGFVHRTGEASCLSNLPRSADNFIDAGLGGANNLGPEPECTRDEDCPGPHGFCAVGRSGEYERDALFCRQGCITDEDCGRNAMCVCGEDIGVCTYRTGCQSDDECSGGALCVGALQNNHCSRYPEWEFACQAANDECILQSECGSWESCLGLDGRQCEDIICE